ncbi:MAG: acetate/propionate family kinase [Acidobacteriia bacterium]|nr:acetate/propionate family kinase [Terriglobia bacterium]
MTPPRCVLTLNSGSSSLKFAVYPIGASEPVLKGKAERIGLEGGLFQAVDAEGAQMAHEQRPLLDHAAALQRVLECARGAAQHSLVAVGHRVVRGGAEDADPQPVTPALLSRIRELIPYLPEHLPHQVAAIEAVERFDSSLTQVVCFDTAFHRTLPRIAQLYALPRDLLNDGILRYGFHGLSYEYVIGEFARLAGETAAHGRVVIAHLGNGCSMAAIRDGRSIDTTMGFTPTGGLMMSSRSGDLDPGVVVYLLEQKGFSAAELSDILNRRSGLAGVSGGSSDMRDLFAREATDPQAAEAIALFCYQARKFLGALAAVLGGLDALIFTAGIGENVPEIRRRICDGMGHLGLALDSRANDGNAPLISSKDASVSIRVIPTNEELMIARHTVSVISRMTR